MSFHAKDGLFFERGGDGSVVVSLLPEDDRSLRTRRIELDAGTWASVVASVSAGGETYASFATAQAFHTGTVRTSTAGSSPLGDWLDEQRQSFGESP